MAYIYTPFMKKVLYITKRKWKSNVHHYCKSDDVRTGFKVSKKETVLSSKDATKQPCLLQVCLI